MPTEVLIHPSSGILTFQVIRVGRGRENRVLALAVQIRVEHLENTLCGLFRGRFERRDQVDRRPAAAAFEQPPPAR